MRPLVDILLSLIVHGDRESLQCSLNCSTTANGYDKLDEYDDSPNPPREKGDGVRRREETREERKLMRKRKKSMARL